MMTADTRSHDTAHKIDAQSDPGSSIVSFTKADVSR
jgi:hypothetical protein